MDLEATIRLGDVFFEVNDNVSWLKQKIYQKNIYGTNKKLNKDFIEVNTVLIIQELW